MSTDSVSSNVLATVEEVLPQLGLAYLADETQTWGITRSTPGADVNSLRVGDRVELRVKHFRSFTVVESCSRDC